MHHLNPEARKERSLAALLAVLTTVSGLVDAATYLKFGHVFVANMTGNIVFVGFALAGAGGLSLVSSAVAVAAFYAGGLAAGRLVRWRPLPSAGLLRETAGLELALVLLAIATGFSSPPTAGLADFAIIVLLAAAMGVQSHSTSRLQVPGFNSTVVLTTMLATMAAASRAAGGAGADNGRRMLAIGAMLAGGLIGALLVLHVNRIAPLVLAGILLALVAAGAHRLNRFESAV